MTIVMQPGQGAVPRGSLKVKVKNVTKRFVNIDIYEGRSKSS